MHNLREAETRDYLILALILGLTLFLQMGHLPGFFHDGYLYAAFGKNAAERGTWLIPHLSDSVYGEFFHHIPFVFILEGLFFKVFGASYLTARIFNSLFALGTVVLVWSYFKDREKRLAFFAPILLITLPPLMKKMRFPSLDPALMFFTCCCLFSYLKAIEKEKIKYWVLGGLGFGAALLTKGPIAFLLIVTIFMHLLFTRRLKAFKTLGPWISFLLGIGCFFLWPLALYLNGRLDIFYSYIDFTFFHTIKDSRGEPAPFYTYFVFLLKNASLWFLLGIIGSYKVLKESKKFDYEILSLIFFWVSILLLSIPGFKYSHYLIPIYPFLAILAGKTLIESSDKVQNRFFGFFKLISVVLPLVLLIFPLTNTSKRDPELFKVRELISLTGKNIDVWGNVNGAYPFYSIANLNAFEDHSDTYNYTTEEFLKKINSLEKKNWAFLIRRGFLNELSVKQRDFIESKFKKLITFKKKNIEVLVEKDMFSSEYLFQGK